MIVAPEYKTVFKEMFKKGRKIRMENITKFSDIPQFTRNGSWECDFDVYRLKCFIEDEVSKGLQLTPKFQRGHVWTEEQQIAWLEYFLRGGKSGTTVYLNCPDWNLSLPDGAYNEYVCVDGLQRITAVMRFINNEIPVFGTYYKDFEDKPRMRHCIKVNINDLQSEREVLQWYVDMNSGGTPHTTEEIERVKQMIEQLESDEWENFYGNRNKVK